MASASSPKCLALPRLQLLALILLLGVVLLPKNSMAALKCWKQTCSGRPEKCLKKPAEPETNTTTCYTGYCLQKISEDRNDNGKTTYGAADRLCAESAIQGICLRREPEGCIWFNIDSRSRAKYYKCLGEKQKDKSEFESGAKGRNGDGGTRNAYALCACDTELCNDRITIGARSGATGGKQLGFGCSIAVVGALLVSAFPSLACS